MLIQGSSRNVNLTNYVLEQSKKEALQVYTRHVYDLETGGGPLGWFNLLTMRSANLSKEQLGVFRALHAWRDAKAREVDEGIQYILPNRVLWLVAESMPMSAFKLHSACRSETKYVSDRVPEILEVVKQGKAEGKNGLSYAELLEYCEKAIGVTVRRKPPREKKEQQQTTYSGLGDTLKQLAASRQAQPLNYDGSVDVEKPVAVRSSASSFWGEVVPQYQQLPADIVAATEALSSILPLHHFTNQPDAALEEPTTQPPLPAQATKPVKMNPLTAKDHLRSKANEIFTLNDLSRSSGKGKKRKADEADGDDLESSSLTNTAVPAANGSSAPSTPTIATSPTQTQIQTPDPNDQYEVKRAAKKLKKERKKAEKAAAQEAAKAAHHSTTPMHPRSYILRRQSSRAMELGPKVRRIRG